MKLEKAGESMFVNLEKKHVKSWSVNVQNGVMRPMKMSSSALVDRKKSVHFNQARERQLMY